jgi:hypothetical protein
MEGPTVIPEEVVMREGEDEDGTFDETALVPVREEDDDSLSPAGVVLAIIAVRDYSHSRLHSSSLPGLLLLEVDLESKTGWIGFWNTRCSSKKREEGVSSDQSKGISVIV